MSAPAGGDLGGADGSVGQGVLERALMVLGSFTEDKPELSAIELAERTGLALSTMHRLIRSLLRQGLLTKVPDHRYAVGPRLWELGELSPMSVRLRERSIPHLMRLYEATGENVHLAVLGGAEPEQAVVLYVDRVTGRQSIPTVSRAGGRGPLHATGVGKALLAGRDEGWLQRYFSTPRESETTHTITDEAAMRAEIERTRVRGYAVTREEMTLGNISVAAALPPMRGIPPVAVGVVVHLDRADSAAEERRLGSFVTQSAREIYATTRQP